jgi:hypothetical protein
MADWQYTYANADKTLAMRDDGTTETILFWHYVADEPLTPPEQIIWKDAGSPKPGPFVESSKLLKSALQRAGVR